MKNVKKMRKDNAKFLAQLRVDQLFYAKSLKDYDESGLRTKLSELKGEQQKEKEKLEVALKASGRKKDEKPSEKELELFMKLQIGIAEIEKVIASFSERAMGREKGLKTIKDIKSILAIIDGLTSSQRKELNNL